MDLLSAIIRLRAKQSAQNIGFLGRHVQTWFLREIERHDSDMSRQLHEDSGDAANLSIFRPYTLSTLMKGEYPPREVFSGDWCYVRITSLTHRLSEYLFDKVFRELLPVNRLGPLEFDVESWKDGPPETALCRVDNYESLKNEASSYHETRIPLDFSSPTTFSQKNNSNIDIDYPLPAPDMVFGSYQKRWSTVTDTKIESGFGEFLADYLAITELRIRSEWVRLSQKDVNQSARGFIGHVCYKILGSRDSRDRAKWEHYSSIIRKLALYSFYCGTGHHTTIGMGQTRLLPPKR